MIKDLAMESQNKLNVSRTEEAKEGQNIRQNMDVNVTQGESHIWINQKDYQSSSEIFYK